MRQLVARSISRSVLVGPMAGPAAGWRVLAVFDRACDLVTPGGDVIALVLAEVGDGPLNVVVAGQAGAFVNVQPGARAHLEGTALYVGGLSVALNHARIWEPRPDWGRLRQSREAVENRLPLLGRFALEHALPDRTGFSEPVRSGPAFQKALLDLQAGWEGDLDRLSQGAVHLAGLGAGLTPAGDDFLVGVMQRAWLAHPEPQALGQCIVQAAAPRTTTLSAALLRAAARGDCSIAWHRLLSALERGPKERLAACVRQALACGHSSGADTLAGFLLSFIAANLPHATMRRAAACEPVPQPVLLESTSDVTARIASARASGTSS